jgi:4-hydroxythreonine-4-phosphate dehydrogenase
MSGCGNCAIRPMWTSDSKTTNPVIGLSAGEPAGIGPDLCAGLAHHDFPVHLVIAADRDVIIERAQLLGLPPSFGEYSPHTPHALEPGCASIWHHPVAAPVVPGRLNVANSAYVLNCLNSVTDACAAGIMSALVTAPLQKSIIEESGLPFTGHTEYLAQRLHAPRVVMMLVGGGLRVALATTHLPLRAVPDAISQESLGEILDILHHSLRSQFNCPHPRILVAGLNPHAGESGHLGREEIDVIIPALNAARARGIDAVGPLPADTLFVPERLLEVDCVLAMYHDQGLPVLKMQSFGEGVNVTLGLPIIRTSVDHGTALDRAGTGHLERGSLDAAIDLALSMWAQAKHLCNT